MKDITSLLQESERTKLDIYFCITMTEWMPQFGGLLVTEGIIRPVVPVSTLTWVIRYIYYCNLLIPKTKIIIKTTFLLPRSQVT